MAAPVHVKRAGNPALAARRITEILLRERPPGKNDLILIKPNIVKPDLPPVTTDVRVVKGIVAALLSAGLENLVVAEGSGTGSTLENFKALGYDQLGVRLVDLDACPVRQVQVPEAEVWQRIHLPDILEGAFIVTVPVMKEHSILGITLGLKNMVGCLHASRYSGYWSYKKSEIHRESPHGCVSDLIRVARPAWCITDGTVGMLGSHISGTPMNPPANTVYGSVDALEADKHGASVLGHDWRNIEYLSRIAAHWQETG